MEHVFLKKNLIEIKDSHGALYLEFFKGDFLRIYRKKNADDLYEVFRKKYLGKLQIREEKGAICIDFANKILKFTSTLQLELIKKNGEIISQISLSTQEDKNGQYHLTEIRVSDNSKVYGLGDKMAPIDKKGYYFKSWAKDEDRFQNELCPNLYKAINYMLIENNLNFYGLFFPSTYEYHMDVCKNHLNDIQVISYFEECDFYLFLGENPKDITANYSAFVGHPYYIPMKLLGYHQSRWSYENEKMLKDLFANFKKYDLPLDYIHLDIHYMDGYRDFTVDKSRFPDLANLSKELRKDNVELVVINDAAIKVDDHFPIYQHIIKEDMCVKYEGIPYVNVVWPGDSVFPNYLNPKVREYFQNVYRDFVKEYDVINLWCDMDEPASFKGELPLDCDFSFAKRKLDHRQAHNLYGENMIKSFVPVFEERNLRPFLFTRSAFATTSKYAFVWNGDNYSFWHHLKYSIPQNLSLSISNFMFNGCDIGGFGGDANKEIFIRWVQANLFMPFFRNHSSLNTKSQEPYAYDNETLNIFKKYISLRYRFIPYLYNLVHNMAFKGETIVRPLFFNYPHDLIARNIEDEYMVGDNLLVAPILSFNEKARIVYLPKGNWINLLTNEKYKGGKRYILTLELDQSAYFIKEDSIIPEFENLKYINKEEIDTLVLRLYGKKGKLELADDDGKTLNYRSGIYNKYVISFKGNELKFVTKSHKYNTSFKKLKIIIGEKVIIKDFDYNMNIDLGD